MGQSVYLVFNGVAPYILESFAIALSKAHNISSVGALVYRKQTYRRLRESSELSFESLELAQTVHANARQTRPDTERLAELEERYGEPFLPKFLLVDEAYRTQSHEEQAAILQGWLTFFEELFDQLDPDLLLTNRIDGTYALVPYALALQRGANAVRWTETRVGNRYAIVENRLDDTLPNVRQEFEALRSGDVDREIHGDATNGAESYLNTFRTAGSKPGFFERRKQTYGNRLFRSVLRDYRRGILGLSGEEGGSPLHERYEATDRPNAILEATQNAYTRSRLTLGNWFDKPSLDHQYLFYPLHAQPEPSIGLYAPSYLDQISLVEQIARSVPVNYRLYVKEHPRMYRDNPRPFAQYERLASTPKVTMVPPDTDSHRLIRGSEGVITITGTPGFEAALAGRPALTFGPTHFNALSCVHTYPGLGEIDSQIQTLLSDSGCGEGELLDYLTAIYAQSFESPSDIYSLDPDEQRSFARSVERRLELSL